MLLVTYVYWYFFQVFLRSHYKCAGHAEYSVRSHQQRVLVGSVEADGGSPPHLKVDGRTYIVVDSLVQLFSTFLFQGNIICI